MKRWFLGLDWWEKILIIILLVVLSYLVARYILLPLFGLALIMYFLFGDWRR